MSSQSRKRARPGKRLISTYIPEEQMVELERIAEREDRPVASLVRIILAREVERELERDVAAA